MSADQQDMINHLMMQAAMQQTGPSLYGLQAQVDPNNIQALLGKMKQQQVLDQANAPTGSQYGYLHDAGKAAFNSIGSSLGGQLAAFGNGPQQGPSPQIQAQRDAIMAGNQGVSSDLADGIDPEQVKINALTKAAQAGLPGAAEALDKAVEAQQKTLTAKQQAYKDNAQGQAALDEIQNRAKQQDLNQKKFDHDTAKDAWTTIGQGNGYIVQRNGLGEIQTKKNTDAASSSANALTPQGMAAMLDSYHTTGVVPTGVAKAGLMGKFWDAEADYQNATGNQAAATAANRASLKANTEALGQTQKQISATTSYFDTMDKNIANARALANSINLTDATALNRAYAAWEKGTSDPQFAKYNLFFDSVANEYAKIKSGSLGNAPVSDSARHEAMGVLLPTMSSAGVNAVFDAIKQEGQNRLDSLNTQRDDLVGRISGKKPSASAPPAASAPQGQVVDFGSLK